MQKIFLKFFKIFLLLLANIGGNFAQNVCFCVTTGNCGTSTSGSTDGSNSIDIRIVAPTGTTLSPTVSPSTVFLSCQAGLSVCCLASYQCGIRYPPVAQAPQPAPGSGHTSFVLLAASDSSYQGSGVLIDHLHVLTVAHKVSSFASNGQQLKVRLGEWDASQSVEPIPAQEYFVSRIFIHPAFNSANLKNDVAILRLSNSVLLGQTPTITTACLPSAQITGQRCFVAGWGKTEFNGGTYSSISKEVDVPIVDQNTCQNQLRLTRLSSTFQLDFVSFMCAGGEAGKDACVGDGGSPLVCKVGNNWFVAGLVAWGIGCAQANVPGVYVNVVNYISWIQQTTRS
ncbi:hypothetical protein PVAND_016574 [Polypedilum vanderplanki]|uniref:Peptidase S1 domain-containing protein n=1 Tax=Polypedilum vanderplanki TaxID=319348 RepID=A0A9J6BGB9_POLVA|nr:hypothetical protein PVAND_016574 [Polypedilum vanderplanki]